MITDYQQQLISETACQYARHNPYDAVVKALTKFCEETQQQINTAEDKAHTAKIAFENVRATYQVQSLQIASLKVHNASLEMCLSHRWLIFKAIRNLFKIK